ncbi:MAG: HDOD domain-containing protein [Pseudomonadales bacterium]|nr:HDOD domain-containing protein [Pseudomonadales bacterium]
MPSIDSLLDTVKTSLLTAIDNDSLTLPTLPEVALKIREAASNPDLTAKELAELMGKDAAISARLIRVANSPLARTLHSIESLPAAINRLGITYCCNLAVGLAMEQMFQATNESIDMRMRQAWLHCTEVAAVAGVLARHYTHLAPDQAVLAGLVHEIGILPVLSYAEEHAVLTSPEQLEMLEKLIADCHPLLGARILQAWHFPEWLRQVPEGHTQVNRQSDEPDYIDIVIVAKLQCLADSSHSMASINWQTVPAFQQLGLSPDRTGVDTEEFDAEKVSALSALFY